MCYIHLQGAFTVLHFALNKFKANKQIFVRLKVILAHLYGVICFTS